jgi:hypothetical protein
MNIPDNVLKVLGYKKPKINNEEFNMFDDNEDERIIE